MHSSLLLVLLVSPHLPSWSCTFNCSVSLCSHDPGVLPQHFTFSKDELRSWTILRPFGMELVFFAELHLAFVSKTVLVTHQPVKGNWRQCCGLTAKATQSPSLPFIAGRSVKRCRISLLSVQVPSCVPCWLLVHTYPTCWKVSKWETRVALTPCKHSSALEKTPVCYQRCFGRRLEAPWRKWTPSQADLEYKFLRYQSA